MTGVALWTRALARRHWRAWVGVGLVLGAFAGFAAALADGAHRTYTAYPRFARAKHAADLVLAGRSAFGLVGSVDLDQVERRLPVDSAVTAHAFAAFPFSARVDGRATEYGAGDVLPVAAVDDRLGHTIEQWKMLEGRPANPTRIDEATASFELMRTMRLHVGDTLHFHFYDADSFGQLAVSLLTDWPKRLTAIGRDYTAPVTDPANGPTVAIRIVGVEASPLEFPPKVPDIAPILHLTPAFNDAYSRRVVGSPASFIRLLPIEPLHEFQLDVEKLAGGKPVSFISTLGNQEPKVQRSVRAEALVLGVLSGLVAFAGAVATSQALVRQAYTESGDDETLQAIGMRRGQLLLVAMWRSAAIALIGIVVACVAAWLAGPSMLLSLARTANLSHGFPVHWTVLLVASGILLAFTLIVGYVAALFVTRPARAQASRARKRRVLAMPLTQPGVPLSTVVGIRLALQRARRSAPAWTAIVGAALCVAMLTFASTFTAHLQRNLSEKSRYGWNWDVKIGVPALPDLANQIVPALRAQPGLTDLSAAAVTQVAMANTRIDVLGIERVVGNAAPTIVAGRQPDTPDELALGAHTMSVLHTGLGRLVRATIGATSATYRVVGQAVFPEFGDSGHLGTGAMMTVEGLHRVLPTAPRNEFFVKFGAGRKNDEQLTAVTNVLSPLPAVHDARPEDLVNLARGDGLMLVLGALLALLAFAMLTHTIVTEMRHGRTVHATLRALGYTRGQNRLTVSWQAMTLAVGAVLLGLPIGMVAGRSVWSAFANRLGFPSDPFVPLVSVVLAIAGAIGVALLAAVVPSWLVTRPVISNALRAGD